MGRDQFSNANFQATSDARCKTEEFSFSLLLGRELALES